jgi:DeoR family transcriptional regulator of aga operon
MNAHERWSRILDELAENVQVSVEDASKFLQVSAATVRRDLEYLAQMQLLTRTRGGAVSNSTAYDLPLRYNAARNVPQKVSIAEAASALIPLGSVVAITGGTTTAEVARSLGKRSDLQASSSGVALTIVTNSINIANELAVRTHLNLVVLGGTVRSQSYELTGRLPLLALKEMAIDIGILGGNAIDLQMGLSCHNESEASIASEIANRAGFVIAVLDSSKLNKHSFARVCAIQDINTLVTDKSADPGFVEELKEAGVEVVLA